MIVLESCLKCDLRFVAAASVCPECGGALTHEERTGRGQVIAATELSVPPAPWTAPHRLVVVELEGGGRVLAVPSGPLPGPGEKGAVERAPQGWLTWTAGAGAPTRGP